MLDPSKRTPSRSAFVFGTPPHVGCIHCTSPPKPLGCVRKRMFLFEALGGWRRVSQDLSCLSKRFMAMFRVLLLLLGASAHRLQDQETQVDCKPRLVATAAKIIVAAEQRDYGVPPKIAAICKWAESADYKTELILIPTGMLVSCQLFCFFPVGRRWNWGVWICCPENRLRTGKMSTALQSQGVRPCSQEALETGLVQYCGSV